MTAEHRRWLDLTIEDALEPEIPICDPHHHFWDRPGNRYFLDDLLLDLSGGHNVVQTVFIECQSMYRKDGPEEMKSLGETEFVQGIVAQSNSGQYGDTKVAAGIVGFADLTLGDAVTPVLEAHQAASGRFRGVRHISASDPSPDVPRPRPFLENLLADTKFREGFAVLGRMGLSFDAYLYHTQLAGLADLANAFPGVTIILNHVGGPLGVGPYAGKRGQVLEDWKQSMSALAACPNVVVKVGGLVMPVCGFDWHERPMPTASRELAQGTAPYYLHCIEQFGADRCMFESNFPVDKLACSYTVLWNAFKRLAHDFTDSEKASLFHDTAARVYRL
ncbi:MAG: amidohydrolase family protein [Chloroflexi bacterium]|nr:amidohydrolase family protein [Chloroflexota bacterium]MDA1271911.1 amidohydrolase family protein [Chloroflexota bacterium]PKB58900.1 MAG: amidohydrolase [SAR202 cluster bacterium Casp-Chloro-G2]